MRYASRVLVAGLLAGLVVSAAACTPNESLPAAPNPPGVGAPGRVAAFRGLGAWIDVYDYAPELQRPVDPRPRVTLASIDEMAAHGVRTLYLQPTRISPLIPEGLVDRVTINGFVRRARAHGMRVVAWFIPYFADPAEDMRRVRAIHHYKVDGAGFDGIALDIEYSRAVRDPILRSRRAIDLARYTRDLVSARPLAAIVPSPAVLEALPYRWPGFPFAELAPFFDAWFTMSYFTKLPGTKYHDPVANVTRSINRVRKLTGRPNVSIHPIGGRGDDATPSEIKRFVVAARERGAVGWSVFDHTLLDARRYQRLAAASVAPLG